ncbi:MAG: hypothetical protein NC429_06955 [Lachnospiraceae bacterium]|nr:hypothetical protein [Lachnospiraceae bacterium]
MKTSDALDLASDFFREGYTEPKPDKMQVIKDTRIYFGGLIMKIEIEIEDYSKEEGIKLKWERGFSIKVEKEGDKVLILANKAGLISLANHLLTLSQDEILEGAHIHLDEYNSLEENSLDIIIEKAN